MIFFTTLVADPWVNGIRVSSRRRNEEQIYCVAQGHCIQIFLARGSIFDKMIKSKDKNKKRISPPNSLSASFLQILTI